MKFESLKKILRVFLTLQWTKELPRQGFLFFGFKRNEVDSVAAHTYTVTLLAYFLAEQLKKEGRKINVEKVIKMGLLHDLGETIIGDIGQSAKQFAGPKIIHEVEERAIDTLLEELDFKEELLKMAKEYNERKTLEAKLVKIADNLDGLAQAAGVPGADMKYFYPIKGLVDKKSILDFYEKAAGLILKRKIKPFREWSRENA